MIKIHTSNLRAIVPTLHAGDEVLLSGEIYTSRDAAHKRYFQLLDNGDKLPIPTNSSVIYYAGPTPSKNGLAVGSCGPTTSSRMNPYAPRLLDLGIAAIIGKGDMSPDVHDAIIRNKAVYFCAIGGAGALAASCIKEVEVIAFEELGCESVKRMIVEDFPLFVGIDCHGGSIFSKGGK